MSRTVPVILVLSSLLAGCKKEPGAEGSPGAPTAPTEPAAAAAPAPTGPTAAAAAVGPEKTKAFWSWFAANAARLHALDGVALVQDPALGQALDDVHPGLIAEVAEEADGRRQIVISADGDKKLFPVVEELTAAAPDVPGWKVIAFRPRTKASVIEMGATKLAANDVKFVAAPAGDVLAVKLYIPGWTGMDTSEEIGRATFMLLDATLGEHDVETYIGPLDFQPLTADAQGQPLPELAAVVDAFKKR